MKCFILILSILFFSVGCGPRNFEPFNPPPIQFEKTPEYSLDLSSFEKPEKIQTVYLDEDLNETSIDLATYVLLTNKEYSKVNSLLQLAIGYKEITQEQATLINLHINTINTLKEHIELERAKSLQYRELWINAENNYRYEEWEHTKTHIFYKSGIGLAFVVLLLL